ncbi:MAG: hypothetical protein O3A01_06330 [bacterium]|nr:hypothetical protein [bacterium]
MNGLTYVFWGYSSEFVLEPLKEYMVQLGHHCVSLPNNEKYPTKATERDYLNSIEFVLITSNHFTRDQAILAELYPELPPIQLCPIEIINECKPVKSVYYPHDLGTPLVLDEPLFAHYFDLILWPFPWFGYAPKHNNIKNVGWIKYKKTPAESLSEYFNDTQNIRCFFLSEISSYRTKLGIKKTIARLQPLIDNNIPMKLPDWPLSDEYETALAENGATIIPATLNSFDIIQHCQLVLSNALSGIVSEAHYMGKACINFYEPTFVKAQTQSLLFDGFHNTLLCHYDQLSTILAQFKPQPHTPILTPFDFKAAVQAIVHG